MKSASTALRQLLSSVFAAAAALAVGIVCIGLSGFPAKASLRTMLVGAAGSSQAWAATLNEVVPLVLVALAWIVAIRAGRINIGFQGQMLGGAMCATVVGIYLPTGGSHVGLVAAVIASSLGGAVLSGLAAALAHWRGVPEIISTLLMSFMMVQVVAWAIRGPLNEPHQSLPQTSPVRSGARWPTLISETPLHYDILLSIGLACVVAWALRSTTFGWRARMSGDNPEAAQHVGINTSTVGIVAMLLSGGLAGIAGGSLVLSSLLGNLVDGVDGGFGLEGIAVALLAGNSAIACIPAAILLAGVDQGGALTEANLAVPSALVGIVQGLVIVAVAAAANLRTGVIRRTWLTIRDALPNRATVRSAREVTQ
ncbi:ABC transporter permease [Nocardioides terrisoli]|uniref:ABC transporter permease n=1 Tax=Nocardioides terrisoli TaxID=3388267 RepID=UPI00287B6F67|nr:ABC transporter permease [Nocardioides marmorisolisilvae]